jgi:hypothetical protein
MLTHTNQNDALCDCNSQLMYETQLTNSIYFFIAIYKFIALELKNNQSHQTCKFD